MKIKKEMVIDGVAAGAVVILVGWCEGMFYRIDTHIHPSYLKTLCYFPFECFDLSRVHFV